MTEIVQNCTTCRWAIFHDPHGFIICSRFPQTVVKPAPLRCGEYQVLEPDQAQDSLRGKIGLLVKKLKGLTR